MPMITRQNWTSSEYVSISITPSFGGGKKSLPGWRGQPPTVAGSAELRIAYCGGKCKGKPRLALDVRQRAGKLYCSLSGGKGQEL